MGDPPSAVDYAPFISKFFILQQTSCMTQNLMPFLKNTFIFERVKALGFTDRKMAYID